MCMIMALLSLGTRDGFSNLTLTVVAGGVLLLTFGPDVQGHGKYQHSLA